MKNNILTVLTLLTLSGVATHAANYTLFEDWTNCPGNSLPDGWTTLGTDKTPAGYASALFEFGEGMKVMELPDSSEHFAVSYSTTLEGGKVDTRLISPSFTVPSAGAILSFKAVNYNPEGSVANKIEVFVHDESNGNEESILMTRVPSNSVNVPQTYNLSLGAYAGREINLIIANEGTGAGLLGIGSLLVSEYVGEIYDSTPLFTSTEENRKLSLSVRLLAPCRGFTAKLTTSTGLVEEFSNNKDLSEAYTTYNLSSKKNFKLQLGEVMDYTLTVIPNMEGVDPLVLTSSTGCGEGFPNVCVAEEGTGERCGYCPAGIAALEKYANEYDDRFIGIAIHCTEAFSTGVMEAPSYADPFVNNPIFPIDGLPAAVLNRSVMQSPSHFKEIDNCVESIINGTSVAQTYIKSVEYDPDSYSVKVKFNTSLSLPLVGTDLKAAAVLLADNLSGNNMKWWQHNYFSGTTQEEFLDEANEQWWEYMKFFCEYPADKISPTDMKFNHVAMGIYPDFYGNGCPLKSDWTDGDAETSEINFVMPMQEIPNGFGVQNVEDTAVAVLIFNSRTGEIIAADKMKASAFTISGVNSINEKDQSLRTYYIDINGIRYNVMPSGLCIKVTEYSDGHVTTEKVINK